MAKRKKQPISEGEVAGVMDEVAGANPEKVLKAHSQRPKRDLTEANEELKNHSKFDKFKKGMK